jgi:hypothetical protein
MRSLFVGGKFNDDGGRRSKIAHIVHEGIGKPDDYQNGGSFQELEQIVDSIDQYGLIYWFADVPNDKPKLVSEIKKKHKACVLVTSKNNLQGKYAFGDLVNRALRTKSNLLVEFSNRGQRFQGRVLDPLGNVFLDHNEDFLLVGKVLGERARELMNYTRMGSRQIGEAKEIPDEKEFFSLIKSYAEKFHELVHGSNPERMMGNASFRCERGFPSFRKEGLIYVSRRNIDKRYIGREGFVAVKGKLPLQYFGKIKPSVDTPIQVRLYQHFENLRYMLHGHVYVKGARFTDNVVPCGALEEADEVIRVFPDKSAVNLAVNLRGHGSLVLVDDVNRLKDIEYITRKTPEVHHGN